MRHTFPLIVSATLLWSVLMAITLYRHASSLAESVGFGALPATQSLLAGHGLTICSETLAQTLGNPLCFHSARMPMAEWVLALAIHLFGPRLLPIALFKTFVFLIPLYAAIYIATRRLNSILSAALLLFPFAVVPFWLDIASLDFEEAYTYSLIALAVAIALFWSSKASSVPHSGSDVAVPQNSLFPGLLVGLTIAAIYLSKSAMIAAAFVLLAACLYVLHSPGARILAITLAIAAPVGWATWQHHVSGRATLGTSLDGFNLHMGNSPNFLRDYPPVRSLDDTASQLNAGHFFATEWALNDYHQRAAILFIRTHPAAVVRGELRKFRIMFLSVTAVGTWRRHGISFVAEVAGLVAFRLLFWASLLLSAFHLLRGPASLRWPSAVYLAFVAAATLPYMLGFGYTRHVSILIYPTVLFCCRLLQPPTDVSFRAKRDSA